MAAVPKAQCELPTRDFPTVGMLWRTIIQPRVPRMRLPRRGQQSPPLARQVRKCPVPCGSKANPQTVSLFPSCEGCAQCLRRDPTNTQAALERLRDSFDASPRAAKPTVRKPTVKKLFIVKHRWREHLCVT